MADMISDETAEQAAALAKRLSVELNERPLGIGLIALGLLVGSAIAGLEAERGEPATNDDMDMALQTVEMVARAVFEHRDMVAAVAH